MNSLSRLLREISLLRRVLSTRDLCRYGWAMLRAAPAVVRARSLAPADLSLHGAVSMRIGGDVIHLPLDEIERVLARLDPTPTFGGAREMFAGNVYLRASKPGLKARTIVDLGSNRGLFLLQAAKVLRAEIGVGVEPQIFYDPAFAALAAANGLDTARFRRIGKRVSAIAGPDKITVEELMRDNGLSSIDFLKCDIEGGEFDVFLDNNEFLQRVDNVAMELHPHEGEVARIVGVLEDHQFEVRVTDQFGCIVPHQAGDYLYASRTGELCPQ